MTVLASPLHVLPQELTMPAFKDPLGGGAIALRRQYSRPLSSWQLEIPGKQEALDPILSLLEYVQGDEPIWFDGAGFAEVTEPTLVFLGDGSTTDISFRHRYVIIASIVLYVNDTVTAAWAPLGSDVQFCDAIRMSSAPGANYQVKAKYRRMVKCVVRVEDKVTRHRVFRSEITANNIHSLVVTLDEVAV